MLVANQGRNTMSQSPPPETSPKAGAPSFVELGVPQGERARAFFEQLFGWTFHDMGQDNFWAQTPTLRLGLHPKDPDALMVIYFAVDDIDAAARRVRELGGRCDDPGPEQEGFGRFVECRDPQGVRFGLRQVSRKAE
jgi:predicted enzyme related to lactoylglutathione lyase